MIVHLVNPPQEYLVNPGQQTALGLLYVAAALREAGHEPIVWDLAVYTMRDALRKVMSSLHQNLDKDQMIGLTGTSLDIPTNNRFAAGIKKLFAIPVIAGGAGATLSPEYYDMEVVDGVIQGEGEFVVPRIADGELDYRGVVPRQGFIEDLDSLSFPARDLVVHEGRDVFWEGRYFDGGSTVFTTSRGCPFKCTFCASKGMWGRKIRYRSAGSVLAEMESVIEEFNVRQFRFSDDSITTNRKRLTELCEGFKAIGNLAWRASIRVNPADVSMFQEMRESGCREVSLGVESGDQQVLDFLAKGTTVEQNLIAIRNAKEAGLVVRILMMIGTPGENHRTVERNKRFLMEADYDAVALKPFVPLPGTPIWNDPGRHGVKILDRDMENYNFYFWTSDGESKRIDLVSIEGLTLDEIWQHKVAMRDFVVGLGKANKG